MAERLTSESRGNLFFVGGVNGVGKTTILTEIGKTHPDYRVVKGSTRFMEWLGIKPGDYDTLRSLPDDLKDRELDKMMRHLAQEHKGGDQVVLFDSHYMNCTDGRYIDGIGDWITLMDALFLVTADASVALDRILADQAVTGRDRRMFKQGLTPSEHQKALSAYLDKTMDRVREVATKYNIPYYVINNDGSIQEAVDQFIQYAESQRQRR